MPEKPHNKSAKSNASALGRGQMPKRLAWGVLVTIAALVLGFLLFKARKPERGPSPAPPAMATNSPSASSSAYYEKLKGRWLRPDGEYVLQINGVDDEGKIEAAYFNPNRINVARAKAFRDGSDVKVYLELRDVNYPGCTYTLVYNPQKDVLTGIYFQAALQQQYEIQFERLKD